MRTLTTYQVGARGIDIITEEGMLTIETHDGEYLTTDLADALTYMHDNKKSNMFFRNTRIRAMTSKTPKQSPNETPKTNSSIL